jgi:hypothetical protein
MFFNKILKPYCKTLKHYTLPKILAHFTDFQGHVQGIPHKRKLLVNHKKENLKEKRKEHKIKRKRIKKENDRG